MFLKNGHSPKQNAGGITINADNNSLLKEACTLNTYSESYDELYHKLKQQEKTIAQLVEIIAATNKRVYDLDRRQLGYEHRLLLRERTAAFSNSRL
ncbi:hypothetical protein [Thalassobacillus pellis]|uniref:hypothetical protein n=1 Tax=Thalassobacillus pellis TaxID=748008 RepID=UPI0019618EC5|nr:hypothetical protein [Thalassobacillus pellis]MBM7551423.1 hypothetical protein [Thalassobacillus pellis]